MNIRLIHGSIRYDHHFHRSLRSQRGSDSFEHRRAQHSQQPDRRFSPATRSANRVAAGRYLSIGLHLRDARRRLLQDTVDSMASLYAFRANMMVLKTHDRMLGTLLDTKV